ncbi:HEPN domain-containing protein [Rhodococcus opacus]|nr:HEPN domain-containing protein [Rhodococcus opacus]
MFRDAAANSASADSSWRGRYPRSAALLPLWSDGQQSTLKFESIPGIILMDARVQKYAASNVVGPVQEATIANLDLARQLSLGETITVPTYVGLSGIRLSDDVEHIGLEGIRLRRSTPLDPGCLNGTTRVWTIGEIDTELKYLHNEVQASAGPDGRANVRIPDRTHEHTDIIDGHRRNMASKLERLRFALLLSSGVDDALASTEVFTTTDNPMTGSWAQLPSDLPHNAQAREISAAVAQELDEWLPKVSDLPDQLLLPMRRLLRAAAERGDPVDSLVDAVVCWEGLFGAETEIRFQVTGAMSVLLEPSIEQRQVLYKELGDLYSLRSRIVHGAVDVGAKKFSPKEAAAHAQRSVAVGISAFREVLSRPDLIEAKKSRERSQRILLGF